MNHARENHAPVLAENGDAAIASWLPRAFQNVTRRYFPHLIEFAFPYMRTATVLGRTAPARLVLVVSARSRPKVGSWSRATSNLCHFSASITQLMTLLKPVYFFFVVEGCTTWWLFPAP